jgi:ABC-type cobalamin/Fe3+-siderophores transport system ATPase subunit
MILKKAVISGGNEIKFGKINLIVGPNNTGKSTLLRELFDSLGQPYIQKNVKWLESLTIDAGNPKDDFARIFPKFDSTMDYTNIGQVNSSEIDDILGFAPYRPTVKQNINSYNLSILLQNTGSEATPLILDIEKTENAMSQNTFRYDVHLRKLYKDIYAKSEFCETRLSTSFDLTINDILDESNMEGSPIRELRENPRALKELQAAVKKIFGVKIGFDNLEQGGKPLRILPDKIPSRTMLEKDLALAWKESSPLLRSQGDGIRAFIGLALTLLDPFSAVVFIDEPEAFLHPPQRRSLGKLVSDMSVKYEKQLFIATHDSEFIRGLLQASDDLAVFNLRKDEKEKKEITLLDLRAINSILQMSDIKLKDHAKIMHESILNSLFFDKTILVESDNDRIFYEYYSNLRHNNLFQNRQFVGFNGIDDVLDMMQKMHDIGVNVAGIVDIDFLLTKRPPEYIRMLDIDLSNKHSALKQRYGTLSNDDKKLLLSDIQKHGLDNLSDDDRTCYERLIDGYSKLGLFVVPKGDLERWTGGASKNNLSVMLGKIRKHDVRKLSSFMKKVLS